MVWQRGVTAPPPPFLPVPRLDHAEQRDVESVGKACGWKHPWAPSVRRLFDDDRATPAVLNFLRETNVGRLILLVPSEEEGGVGDGDG